MLVLLQLLQYRNRLARCRNCLPFQGAFIHTHTYRCCSCAFNFQCIIFFSLSSFVAVIIVLHFHFGLFLFCSCNKRENVHSALNSLKNWISHNVLCFNQDFSFGHFSVYVSKACYRFWFSILLIMGYTTVCISMYFNSKVTDTVDNIIQK